MDKKQKKAAIRARNKRQQIINHHVEQHAETAELARQAEADILARQAQAADAARGDGDEPWTARTQMIRNRLTNKRRKSTDRWNRFAGTESGGGRGR